MYLINNYQINKELIFYPLNKLKVLTLSLINNRLVSKNVKCKYCNTETFYECTQCNGGITEVYQAISNSLIKKLPLIESKILSEINSLSVKEKIRLTDKDNAINYLQNFLKRKNVEENDLVNILNLNKEMGEVNEVSYYILKSLDKFDSKVVFLLKLYEFIINLAKGELNPYNLFFYKYYNKYEYFINDNNLNLPIEKKEFDELYQNVPEYIGSLINFYSPNNKYPRQIITNKNYYCDINFGIILNCRLKDNKVFYLNSKVEKKSKLQLRNKIRSEFGLKKVSKVNIPKLPRLELSLKLINCKERKNNNE